MNVDNLSVGEAPAAKKRKTDPFADLRDDAPSTEQPQIEFSCSDELSKYKALLVMPASSSPLHFWKTQAKDFPILAGVARRVLCVSASSAQSERDFSSVGRSITDARSRLSAKTVECIELVRWGLRGGFV
jgi:hypothetical protein